MTWARISSEPVFPHTETLSRRLEPTRTRPARGWQRCTPRRLGRPGSLWRRVRGCIRRRLRHAKHGSQGGTLRAPGARNHDCGRECHDGDDRDRRRECPANRPVSPEGRRGNRRVDSAARSATRVDRLDRAPPGARPPGRSRRPPSAALRAVAVDQLESAPKAPAHPRVRSTRRIFPR